MNKISMLAFVGVSALALPALAQTPADLRNGRTAVQETPAPVQSKPAAATTEKKDTHATPSKSHHSTSHKSASTTKSTTTKSTDKKSTAKKSSDKKSDTTSK